MQLSQALTRLATERDAEALTLLYERLGPAIRRLATRITADPQLGEDCVVEVVLSAARSAPTWRPHSVDPEQDARRWVLGIATTTARSMARARRRAGAREARAMAAAAVIDAPAPESGLCEEERVAIVQQAVAQLPKPYADAVAARYVDGLDVKGTASRLGIPEATVKTRVFRGLSLLKRRLETWRGALTLVGSLRWCAHPGQGIRAAGQVARCTRAADLAAALRRWGPAPLGATAAAVVAMTIHVAPAAPASLLRPVPLATHTTHRGPAITTTASAFSASAFASCGGCTASSAVVAATGTVHLVATAHSALVPLSTADGHVAFARCSVSTSIQIGTPPVPSPPGPGIRHL